MAHDSAGVTVAGHLQSTTNPPSFLLQQAHAAAQHPGLRPAGRRWRVFEGKVAASNMLKGTTTNPDYAGAPDGRVHD